MEFNLEQIDTLLSTTRAVRLDDLRARLGGLAQRLQQAASVAAHSVRIADGAAVEGDPHDAPADVI